MGNKSSCTWMLRKCCGQENMKWFLLIFNHFLVYHMCYWSANSKFAWIDCESKIRKIHNIYTIHTSRIVYWKIKLNGNCKLKKWNMYLVRNCVGCKCILFPLINRRYINYQCITKYESLYIFFFEKKKLFLMCKIVF